MMNLNAKVRLGMELESSYSMTNSKNLKKIQPIGSSFVTLAAFEHLLRRSISLSIPFCRKLIVTFHQTLC